MNNPHSYAQHNQVQRQIAYDVLKSHAEKIQWRSYDQDTLIDIGSGPGDTLIEVICPFLRRKLHRIVASDINKNMVEYAGSHFQHVANCEFKVFDIETDLELPNDLKGQFDHVISFLCLQMVENQMKAFQNIYQLIRPEGGDCLLNIFARGAYFDAYLELSKSPKWSPYMANVNKYTSPYNRTKKPEQEVRHMLECCGYSNIDVKLCKKTMEFDSIETLKVIVRSSSPYVHHMPKELHHEFAEEYAKAYVNCDKTCMTSNEIEGKFHFNFHLLVIYARR